MTKKEKLIIGILKEEIAGIKKVGDTQKEMLDDLRENGYGAHFTKMR